MESKPETSSSFKQMALSFGSTWEPVKAIEKGRCLNEANWLSLSRFSEVLISLL